MLWYHRPCSVPVRQAEVLRPSASSFFSSFEAEIVQSSVNGWKCQGQYLSLGHSDEQIDFLEEPGFQESCGGCLLEDRFVNPLPELSGGEIFSGSMSLNSTFCSTASKKFGRVLTRIWSERNQTNRSIDRIKIKDAVEFPSLHLESNKGECINYMLCSDN